MATIRVNMDARSKGGVPVPDGDYLCEVVSVVDGQSSQKKSPQLNVQLEVADGPYKGGRLLDFLPMTDASAFRSADFFYALGVEEPGENDIDTDSFSRLDAEGNEIQEQGSLVQVRKTTTEEKDGNGEIRKRIRLYYSRVPVESQEATEEVAEEAPTKAAVAAPKPAIKKAAPAAPAKPAVGGKKVRVQA